MHVVLLMLMVVMHLVLLLEVVAGLWLMLAVMWLLPLLLALSHGFLALTFIALHVCLHHAVYVEYCAFEW